MKIFSIVTASIAAIAALYGLYVATHGQFISRQEIRIIILEREKEIMKKEQARELKEAGIQ